MKSGAEHDEPVSGFLSARPSLSLFWPLWCSARCTCPCTSWWRSSCPVALQMLGSLPVFDSQLLFIKCVTLTLWADCRSSLRDVISCFRHWTSDSFTRRVIWDKTSYITFISLKNVEIKNFTLKWHIRAFYRVNGVM